MLIEFYFSAAWPMAGDNHQEDLTSLALWFLYTTVITLCYHTLPPGTGTIASYLPV